MNVSPIKYAILGDIHANLEALLAVTEDARRQGCTRFACVGDIVGYNANPVECLGLIREMSMVCVKGNHDEYCSTSCNLDNLHPRAVSAIHWTRKQLNDTEKNWLAELKYVCSVEGFSLVHATLDAPHRWGYVLDRLAAAPSFTYQSTSVCFFGHTHVPGAFIYNGTVHHEQLTSLKINAGRKYLLNVGSVGEPRDGNPLAGYGIYDLIKGTVELRRVPFDVEKTEAKLQAAALPLRRRLSSH